MARDRDDDLREVFEEAAGRVRSDLPDPYETLRRGRRRRRNRTVLSAVAGVIAGALFLTAPPVVSDWLDREPEVRIAPAQSGGPSRDGAPGVFAFLALDDAGLLDLSGDYYRIEGVEAVGDGAWRVGLQHRKCVVAQLLETCVEQDGAPFLDVATEGSEFFVADASEELDEESRRALGRFRKPVDAFLGDEWVFSTPQLHVTASPHVDVAMAWLGSTEPSRSGHLCRGNLLDGAGNVVWMSEWRELPRPGSEDERFGGTTGFSRLPSDLDDVERATVDCREVHGLGWNVADASIVDDEGPNVHVQLTMVWDAPSYLQHFTRCEVAVLNGAGEEIGTGEHWLPGPKEGEPPFRDTAIVRTDGDATSAATVDVWCGPVSGDDYETRAPAS